MNNTRKIIGICAVVIAATALLVFAVIIMNKQSEGIENKVSEGDWQFENQWYNYDRNIKTILFIGVADSKTAGENREVKYLTLLAYNELEGKYSLMNIDPDTAVKVNVVDAQGTIDGEAYYGRIGDAQTYGDGRIISCRNTAKSVEELLMYVHVDIAVCIRVGAQKPAFTSDPLAQFEELIAEAETTSTGELVTAIVYSDIDRNRLSDYWNTLNYCTNGEQHTIEGHRDGTLLVPEDRLLKYLIRDLYFKKVP